MVDWSPSMLTILKEDFTSSERARCNILEEIFTSEVMNISVVAILGHIMPTPLAIAPTWQSLPPASNSTATDFGTVSVVIMASAALWLSSPRLS